MSDPVDHTSIYTALATAQAECGPLFARANNPHFKSKYADLKSVLDLIREPIRNNGLVLFQTTTIQDLRTCITTTLVQRSGDGIIESHAYLPNLDDPQKVGSAITYYRRYHLVSLFCLDAEDDDGNEAARPASKPVEAKPTKPVPTTKIPDTETFKANVHNAVLIANVGERKLKIKELADECLTWQSAEHNSILRAAVAHDDNFERFRDWFNDQLQAKLA